MNIKYHIAFFLLAFSPFPVNAKAKIKSIKPDQISVLGAENCRSVRTNEAKWIPENWLLYKSYVKICPLVSKGHTVLSILAIDFQQYFDETKKSPEVSHLPLILGSTGEKMGTLPENFLPDGPTWLQLIFWSWENDFPERIVPLKHSISVSPSEALKEMYWDTSDKTFKTTDH
jgi:hypothetical protein